MLSHEEINYIFLHQNCRKQDRFHFRSQERKLNDKLEVMSAMDHDLSFVLLTHGKIVVVHQVPAWPPKENCSAALMNVSCRSGLFPQVFAKFINNSCGIFVVIPSN